MGSFKPDGRDVSNWREVSNRWEGCFKNGRDVSNWREVSNQMGGMFQILQRVCTNGQGKLEDNWISSPLSESRLRVRAVTITRYKSVFYSMFRELFD